MILDDELCPDCKQPRPGKTSGSLTQWIFVCNCASLKAPDTELDGDSFCYQICRKCKKRIASGRAGSLTQYIFRSDTCRCPSPEGFDVSVTRTANPDFQPADRETFDFDAESLDLPPSAFPLSRFKPIEELGRGAAGAVYLCIDRLLGTRVAVKTLHYLSAEQLLSFQLEARAISKLNHPNIVKILDFGATDSGIPYMVLEYIDGVNLEKRIDNRKTLEVAQAVDIVLCICDALRYSHNKDIFHRDLKPSNILLLNKDEHCAKLVDFGVAMTKFETLTPSAFQGTALVGTPAYMCPDQMQGRDYDRRSEIYSLGCILFELLTGRPVFMADSPIKIANLHLRSEAPTLSDAGRDIVFSEQLQSILDRCLAKDPEERFQDMNELKKALEEIPLQSSRNGRSLATDHETEPDNVSADPARQEYKEALQQAFKNQSLSQPVVPVARKKSTMIPLVISSAACLSLVIGAVWYGVVAMQNKTDPATLKQRQKAVSADKPGTFNNTLLETKFQLNNFNGEFWYFNMSEIEDQDIDELCRHADVKRVWLDSGHISPDSLLKLKPQRVEKFAFINIDLSKKHLENLARLKTIRHLRLFDIPGLSSDNLKIIATMNNLEELFIKADGIGDSGIGELLALEHLKILSLDRCRRLTDASIDTLARFPELQRLSLSGTSITGDGIKRILRLKNLRVLSLAGLPSDSDTVKQLTRTNIERLSLRYAKISPEDFMKLAACKELTMLDVRDIKGIGSKVEKSFEAYRADKKLPPCQVIRERRTKLNDFGEMVFQTVDDEYMWVN